MPGNGTGDTIDMPTGIGGKPTVGDPMKAIAGGIEGDPFPLRIMAPMPFGIFGEGSLVSGARRSWKPILRPSSVEGGVLADRCISNVVTVTPGNG